MLKILYIDALCPIGHKVFNSLTISALSSLNAKITTIALSRCMPSDKCITYHVPDKYLVHKKLGRFSKITYRINEIRKFGWILNLVRQENPDLVVLSSFETITLSIVSRRFRVPVLAFNHNNIDELESCFKKLFFRRMGRNVNYVVFEEYMVDYLKGVIGVTNDVISLPHIVEAVVPLDVPNNSFDNDYFCIFAPSSSNNMSLIEDLLRRKEGLAAHKIQLVAKFREKKDFDSVVLRRRFSNEEYLSYMNSCSAVYVPLSRGFNYRVSNVVNEAIAYNKRVIITRNRYSDFLLENYPSLVFIVSEDLFDEKAQMIQWLRCEDRRYEEDRARFILDHSAEEFVKRVKKFVDSL
ncbi:MAG: hypothetical protein XE05_1929 [Thermotogales bacterium 46_20]|nr:MAG: hypothetical protein XE05_1929 [Thermotogales bacterium 46_20]